MGYTSAGMLISKHWASKPNMTNNIKWRLPTKVSL